jgi:glycosyltransferase involved in cell wall biosynthesis
MARRKGSQRPFGVASHIAGPVNRRFMEWFPGSAPEGAIIGSITVFFPAYNDAESLPALIAKTFDVLKRCVSRFGVIVINDGSSDNTGQVLEELAHQYAPYLRIITHAQNMGYGAALRTGFAASTGEWVFYTDGDGQYDPADLTALLCAADAETALVNGYKLRRHDPAHRIAIGWLYNRFARVLFRIRIRDIDCDFRLIRRKYLQEIDLRSTSGTICVELVRGLELSGGKIAEVPVAHYPRLHGRSQFFRVRSLGVTFVQLCQLFARLVLLPGLTGVIARARARGAAEVRP